MKGFIAVLFAASLAAGCSSSSSSSAPEANPAAKPAPAPKDACLCKGGNCLCSHCSTGKGACACKK